MDTISIVRPKHNARRALFLQYFLMGFIFSSLLSRYPGIRELYGMSIAELSFVPFSMSIGSLLAMPLCGFFLAKYGSKTLSAMGYVYMAMIPFLALMPNLMAL